MKTIGTADGRMAATSPRGAFFFSFGRLLVFLGLIVWLHKHAYTRTDSPRMVLPVVSTGVRMPGSFGCDDDDDEEAGVNDLILGIRKLGV